LSENLDLVRSIFAAWERGDFSSVAWAHPEIESVIADGPAPGRWTGVAEYEEAQNDFFSAWEGYSLAADEYRELDEERVLVLVHASGGRGKTSGLELGRHGGGGATLFHLRDGKVTKYVVYFRRERALADLGLTPDTGTAGS
jgi:ketosteroid isomerase-like protein